MTLHGCCCSRAPSGWQSLIALLALAALLSFAGCSAPPPLDLAELERQALDKLKLGETASFRELMDRGLDPNRPLPNGSTLLIEAVRSEQVDMVAAILGKKGDPNGRDREGETALIHAARAGNTQLIELLVRRGARLGEADRKGKNALHHAAEAGKLYAVRTLFDAGAERSARAANGATAAELAKRAGHEDVAALLGSP